MILEHFDTDPAGVPFVRWSPQVASTTGAFWWNRKDGLIGIYNLLRGVVFDPNDDGYERETLASYLEVLAGQVRRA